MAEVSAVSVSPCAASPVMATDPVGSVLPETWFKISVLNSVSSAGTLPAPCRANKLSPASSSRLIWPESKAVKFTVANLMNSGVMPNSWVNVDPPILETMPASSFISPLRKMLKMLVCSKLVASRSAVGYLSEIVPPAIPAFSLFDWIHISATNWSPAETACSDSGNRLDVLISDAVDSTTSLVIIVLSVKSCSPVILVVGEELSDSAVPWPSV